jgi:hypothetical protein
MLILLFLSRAWRGRLLQVSRQRVNIRCRAWQLIHADVFGSKVSGCPNVFRRVSTCFSTCLSGFQHLESSARMYPTLCLDDRYKEVLFLLDTCHAESMIRHIRVPNVIGVASSSLDEDSYGVSALYGIMLPCSCAFEMGIAAAPCAILARLLILHACMHAYRTVLQRPSVPCCRTNFPDICVTSWKRPKGGATHPFKAW